MPAPSSTRQLVLLVFSQFAGTSLWFAGNAIVDKIAANTDAASATSVVQAGFIAGTFVFSLLTIADRYPAKNVFFISALLASVANVCIIPLHQFAIAFPALRFLTGFFLAGIYPVGMKIAADVFPERLGKVMGFLVGALVLGTAFPHLVRSQIQNLHWQTVLYTTSALALSGGLLVYFFFPANRRTSPFPKPDFTTAFTIFSNKPFRSAAFGYFGHMWELYAFWAILPILFSAYHAAHQLDQNNYWWSFVVIAVGSAGCAVGGLLSQKWGSKTVAFAALLISGACCALAPAAFRSGSNVFYTFILIWGLTVTADSPQFSTLVARAADAKNKGTALTVVTCLGFAITIISIQWLRGLFVAHGETALWLLAPGPVFGLISLKWSK